MENSLNFLFPISKIDKEKRIVTGVATADNIDTAGDEVDFNGSVEAFSKWIGNVREMHGKKAVGKSLEYRPTTVEINGETYRGIEVDAYISKGAPDTWEKVLDGTLRGFSIGGGVIEKTSEYDEKLKRKKNVIKKYELGELSLVDNPCNPAAMLSMVKMADGNLEVVMPGEKYQIFYCSDDKVAKANNSECMYCDTPMKEIGYADNFSLEIINKMIANTDGSIVLEKVTVVDEVTKAAKDTKADDEEDALDNSADEAAEGETESGKKSKKVKKSIELQNNDTDDIVSNTDLSNERFALARGIVKFVSDFVSGESTLDEITKSVETPIVETEVVVEESVEEIEDGGSEEVNIDELKDALSGIVSAELAKVKDELASSVDAKLEAITKSVSDVSEKVEATNAAATEATEKVAEIAASGAIKKSADAEDELDGEKIEKVTKVESFWKGIFVAPEVCELLGYES